VRRRLLRRLPPGGRGRRLAGRVGGRPGALAPCRGGAHVAGRPPRANRSGFRRGVRDWEPETGDGLRRVMPAGASKRCEVGYAATGVVRHAGCPVLLARPPLAAGQPSGG
jgi:hypothetical protein